MPLTSDSFWPWRFRPRGTAAQEPPIPAQELYAALIKDRISPALRSEGLIGSSGRYSVKSPTHWALVTFQKSAYSDRNEIQFTINLLVVRRDEWQRLTDENAHYPPKPAGSISYGRVKSARIGSPVGDGSDKWWRLFHGQDTAMLTADVLVDLRDAGLPWVRQQIAASTAG